MQHTITYCRSCRTSMVLCYKCGNATCNGGHGQVEGKECDMCDDAYLYCRENNWFDADFEAWLDLHLKGH